MGHVDCAKIAHPFSPAGRTTVAGGAARLCEPATGGPEEGVDSQQRFMVGMLRGQRTRSQPRVKHGLACATRGWERSGTPHPGRGARRGTWTRLVMGMIMHDAIDHAWREHTPSRTHLARIRRAVRFSRLALAWRSKTRFTPSYSLPGPLGLKDQAPSKIFNPAPSSREFAGFPSRLRECGRP